MKHSDRGRAAVPRGLIVPVLALILAALLTGCVPLPSALSNTPASGQPATATSVRTEGFAIYLLPGVRSADLTSLDLNSLSLAQPPFLAAEDIVSYTPASHEIGLTLDAFRRVQDLLAAPVPVSGVPFVVTVDRQPIYAGAFWTPLSSLSFEGVVIMDQTMLPSETPEHLTLRIDLGYPGPDFHTGPDPRNDPRILAALMAAGKLR